MPSAAARPWKFFLPLAAVLLLCLLWTVYWFVASSIARDRVAQERARLASEGLVLACTQEAWGGFPFHFEFTCTSPALKLREEAELRSGHLLLTALAYAPWQVVALLDGPTVVSARTILPTQAEHQRAIAAVTFERDGHAKLSAEIPALSVPGLGKAGKVMLHTRPSPSGGTQLALSASDVSHQSADKPELAIAKGELLGTLLPDQSLTVDSIAFEQGKLRYWGAGSLRLDEARRPVGKIDTETNDVNALLGLLEPHLQLTEQQKTGLRSMLGLLGSEAKAPLIAQEGVLYLGPFRIADLAPLY